jgi:hypothetical protein
MNDRAIDSSKCFKVKDNNFVQNVRPGSIVVMFGTAKSCVSESWGYVRS